MANFYDAKIQGAGVSRAGVLIQATGKVGGHRHVFVGLAGVKNGLVYPPIGGKVVNPFKGAAKAFAGDFCEYAINGDVKIMKTYLSAKEVADGTEYFFVRDGYKHIPFVGDVIMVAPEKIDGTGTAVTITAVKATKDGNNAVWKITTSATLGKVEKDAVLVEAEAAGADKKMMVQNPNSFFDADNDFLYDPADPNDDSDYDNARYLYTPALANEDTKLIIGRTSPIPACVLALNKSLVAGWFNL